MLLAGKYLPEATVNSHGYYLEVPSRKPDVYESIEVSRVSHA